MKKIRKILIISLFLSGCEFNLFNSSISTSSKSNTNSATSISSLISSSSNSSKDTTSTTTSSNSNSNSSSNSIEKNEKELLKNNDFSSLENWYIDPNNNLDRLNILNHGSYELKLDINNNGCINYWDIQILQSNIILEKDQSYKVKFNIKSEVNRTFKFIIQKTDYSAYALEKNIDLVANVIYNFEEEIIISDTSTYLYGFMFGNIGGTLQDFHTISILNPSLIGIENTIDSSEGKNGTYDSAPSTYKGRNLVWSDEFNGTSLNKSNWSYDIGTGDWGWGNNEQQYYTDSESNVKVSNGSLKIIARKEKKSSSSYTSGRITTKNKRSYKYGYFEARLAIPSMSGIWPAFWMLGSNIDSVGWPKCGEIDIMEAVNYNNVVYSTLHWNNGGINAEYSPADYGNGSGDNDGYLVADRTKYHTYGMEWTEEYIKTFVDDMEVFYMAINTGNGKEVFQKEHYFLLNVAVGGQWPGYNIGDEFPQAMSVDYLRVYQ